MDDNAPFFGLPNNQKPNPYAPAYYGNQNVPRPTNSAAKVTPANEVIRAVIDAE